MSRPPEGYCPEVYDGKRAPDPDENIDDVLFTANVCAVVAPFAWRGMAPEEFARLFLAATDREHLASLLLDLPGCTVGAWEALEPVDADDVRIDLLILFLVSHRWTEQRLTALCGRLLEILRY